MDTSLFLKVKSESEVTQVTQSYRTFSNPMDCSPPGSSVHGTLQARVLEWDAIAFSNRGAYGRVILFFFFFPPTLIKKMGKIVGPISSLLRALHW